MGSLAAGGRQQLDAIGLARAVDEFYVTSDDSRRQQLNHDLCLFKSSYPCDATLHACFVLLNRANTANVQYFGALSLYDTIRQRWEEIVADPILTEQVKAFLLESLTAGAAAQSQSLTNKLSSSLALLALYSMPDVWSTPVQDLTSLWAATPELLLRVLAELAAEFPNVHMPLTQRSVLKTELHRVSEDMIRILATVLPAAADAAAPSLLNAAVECVEQWLRLPGSNLRQWTELLSVVFAAVKDDSTALTNLLSILAANEELANEDQLVLHILEYICNHLAQKLLEDLSADPLSEDVAALSAAVCTLCESVVIVLTNLAVSSDETLSLLTRLCEFFARLSGFNGMYPVEEVVSELPAVFWIVLREDLHGMQESKRQRLASSLCDVYANVLRFSIDKLAYPGLSEEQRRSAEEQEQFESYRKNRMEDAVNAYFIAGSASLDFLNEELSRSLNGGDVNRVESVLYAWEQVADLLTETEYPQICRCLELAQSLPSTATRSREESRVACTLMRLLYALSHLLSDHPTAAAQLELAAVQMALPHLASPSVTDEALKTLVKITADRPEWLLDHADPLLHRCFALFQDESAHASHRLSALKCIGYALSLRQPAQIMEVLEKALNPYVAGLGESSASSTTAADAGDAAAIHESRRAFQIGIFSCLFTSLHNRRSPEGGEAVVHLLRAAAPVLQAIAENDPSPSISDKVCDALRSACQYLPEQRLSEFFPLLARVIAACMERQASSACAFAKTLVLTCRSVLPSETRRTIVEWATHFDAAFPSDEAEEWLQLMLQVLKKDWKVVIDDVTSAAATIEHSVCLATKALSSSQEPNVVKLAAQLLATVVTQTSNFDCAVARQILEQRGGVIVQIVFERVQVELVRQTVDALAEVLFFFARHFTTATRECIKQQDNGSTPIVSAMFREVGNLRNFKQMTLRLNHVARKDCA